MATVSVRHDADGTVHVGSVVDSAQRTALLDVAGATLIWDVTALGAPAAVVHDVSRARQWLWAVYGPAVDAVQTAAAPVEDTPLARIAARLAYGHWAARWWPASTVDEIPALPADLLGLELAALTYRAQQLFDEEPDQDDTAAELIEEHQAALDPLVRWWQAGGPAEEVLRLVDAAADNLGVDGEALRRLRTALESPAGGPPVSPARLFGVTDDFALAAGTTAGTGRVIATGTGVNDWRRYPPGFVDAADDAVTWTARAAGATRRIAVEAATGALEPAAQLVAEVHADDHITQVPLSRHDGVWMGETELPLRERAEITVAVLLPGFDPGPGDDQRVEREAIRTLARQRLAAPEFLAEIVASGAR